MVSSVNIGDKLYFVDKNEDYVDYVKVFVFKIYKSGSIRCNTLVNGVESGYVVVEKKDLYKTKKATAKQIENWYKKQLKKLDKGIKEWKKSIKDEENEILKQLYEEE